MTIKSILVPINSDEDIRAGLGTAVVLAKQFDAQIRGFHMRLRPELLLSYDLYPGVYAHSQESDTAWRKAENERAQELEAAFKKACEKHGLELGDNDKARAGSQAHWASELGVFPLGIAAAGRVADLTILARHSKPRAETNMDVIETVLNGSGHPLLLVPSTGLPAAPKNILLAWNGTSESAKAVTASLPFLKNAQAVKIITIDDVELHGPAPEKVVELLRGHGIAATCEQVGSGKEKVENVLLKIAKKENTDLIVMGAYSHSRLREFVLGGVTRHILKNLEIPTLMVH